MVMIIPRRPQGGASAGAKPRGPQRVLGGGDGWGGGAAESGLAPSCWLGFHRGDASEENALAAHFLANQATKLSNPPPTYNREGGGGGRCHWMWSGRGRRGVVGGECRSQGIDKKETALMGREMMNPGLVVWPRGGGRGWGEYMSGGDGYGPLPVQNLG